MIELQLLGGLALDGPDLSPNARARQRRPLALLALIAAGAPHALGRNRLMAMLWPESDTERASNSLRQTLFLLRRDLGENLFLPESGGAIQLDSAAVAADLWKFRDAIARNAPGDAVAVYTGPFLDGFQLSSAPEFSDWCDAERTRLAHQYVDALDALAREAEEQERTDDVVRWRRRQAGADPLSSRVALALLRALANAGDRSGALEYASVHESLVRVHLEASPDPLVTEFVASLRDRQVSPDATGGRRVPLSKLQPADVPGVSPIGGPPAAPIPSRSLLRALRPWLTAAAVGAFALGGASLYADRTAASPATSIVVVLASGTGGVEGGGRDRANRLVACNGPACPPGELPQPAFVVPKHVSFTLPVAGTSFIAPVPDGTDAAPPGYKCCTTAVFENEFSLPSTAVSARITITVLADNQAHVAINGVEFGRQTDSLASWNFGGPAATFSTTFPPAPRGTNRLTVTLWDGGGATGLHYHAVVTHETEIGRFRPSR